MIQQVKHGPADSRDAVTPTGVLKMLPFNHRLRWFLTWLLLFSLLSLPAFAAKPKKTKAETKQETATPPPPPVEEAPKPVIIAPPPPPAEIPVIQRTNSINLSVMSTSELGLNYMWRFANHHALVVEGFFDYSSSADAGTNLGAGGQIGYRLLFSGTQDCWFLGLMAGFDAGKNALVTTNTSQSDVAVKRAYNLPYRRVRATLDLGRRWVFGPGFNVTARFGAGPGKRTYARSGDAAVDAQAATVESVANFLPISLDAELSVGWLF